MNNLLFGNQALVTGASRGIGRAIASHLARAGCATFALARDRQALEVLAGELGRQSDAAKITPLQCDLTDSADIDRTLERCPDVSIVINNAGWAAPRTAVAHCREEDWSRTIDTCLLAPMRITRTLLPQLVEDGSGAIVQILSPAARFGRAGEAAYAAAKSGLRGFTESLRDELRDTDIKVCSVYPGFVDTDFIPPNRRVDRSLFLQPDDVAAAVVQLLETPTRCCPTEISIEPQRDPMRGSSRNPMTARDKAS